MQRRLPLRKRRCLHGAEPLEARVVLDSTVVFSELMYNPLGTGESLEWIELHNQMSVNVDLSNWRLDGGVEYTFEAGTVIPGGGYLVIAADPATLLQETGYASALGPYRGNLSNSGEQLRLLNHTDRLMNEVEYGDRDDWPAGPDGSGATLAKSRAQSASHVASNWTTSAQLGGTPGAANFLEAATVEQTTLLSIDQVWRYEQSGTDLGTTWRDPGFNDNSWASGAGLLYSESAALPAPKNTPLTLGERTYYFRTTFDFNDTVGDATLRLNHVVDDGAVFYLNGQEIARFNMPTGAVSAATFANVGVGDAAFTLTGGLNSGLLQSGTNTLAVEVHQVADTSSDVVFGTELLLERVLDDPTTMSTTVRISEVAGSAEPSFWIELENITPNAAALNDMSLVGTGATGGTFSLNGLVIPAHGLLSFDESQLGFRVDPGERVFLTTSTGLLDAIDARDVTRARAAQLNGRWQTPAVGTPGAANQFAFPSDIVINEIMYHARPTYATDAVISPQAVVEIDQTWRFDDTGTDRGTSWREPEYNDSTWNEGAGLFFVETGPLPGPKNTPLTFGRPTYYFRTTFDFQGDPTASNLAFRHVVDDGAVFYLNGVEFGRFNLPSGDITYSTLASAAVGDAIYEGPIAIPPALLRQGTNTLAVELHQQFTFSPDVVFGAEVSALLEIEPATEFRESSEEWIELYNRGASAVDLSGWSLTDAVAFQIPENTIVNPGEYIVIARDAAQFAAQYPDVTPLGEFSGSLSDSGEQVTLRDAVGNVADEVHYFDGGRWPEYADGGGSSLELRNPAADNGSAEAWASSVEQSDWQHVSYTMTVDPIVHDPPINFHEFVMGLLSAGEILIDNISVLENPDGEPIELIQNGTFESDALNAPADKWRIQGTHGTSRVVADPDDPTNQVLHLRADARSSYLSNHAETTLANSARVTVGQTYQISYDAKWIGGSPQLHTELYYKDAARTTILQQPSQSGTPGAPNSTLVANLGPTYEQLQHQPVIPSSTDDVAIRVRAADPNGIDQLTLFYSVNGGAFTSVPMLADGAEYFTASIPAQANNRVVQFYVEGRDTANATSMFPSRGPESRALYKVIDNYAPDPSRHDFNILMTPADVNALHLTTNMMNNDRQGSTVIYDGHEVFYDVGTRLRGSMFTRQSAAATGYNVRFNADQLFRGVHETVAFDQNGEQEILAKFITTQSAHLGGTYDDVFRLSTPSGSGGGPTLAYLARHDDVFLEEQFENGTDGMLFKFEGIRVMTSTVDGNPESLKLFQPIGWMPQFDIQDLGNSKELYRWPFLVNGGRDQDDYSRLIDMAKAFSLTGDALNDAIAEVMDVDNLTQTFALMSLLGIGDVYSQGNPHNLNIYVRPEDDKILLFPWDWDFTFSQSTSAPLHGNKNIGKILDLPHYEHWLLGHMHNAIQTIFNRNYMAQWTNHFGTLLGGNFNTYLSNIDARGSFVLGQLPAEVPFSVGTGDITVSAASANVTGSGWVNVREIRLAGDNTPLPVQWVTSTAWEVDVPLSPGINALTFEAYDFQGNLLGTDQINVTSTSSRPVLDYLRISEIMYHPADPTAEELAAGFNDADDFEFLEFVNISGGESATQLNLAGVDVTEGISFGFGSVTLDAGERVVVARSRDAFAARYGDGIRVVGEFDSGQLSNSGETIRLVDDAGTTVLAVDYSDGGLWPERADGVGASLEFVDLESVPANEATKYYHWQGSSQYGGTPGATNSAARGIVISEVLANTDTTLARSDAIELVNTSAATIDLGGWYLSDSANNLLKYQIPAGTLLGPGQFVVFDESQFNPTPATPAAHHFALNGDEGDSVWLVEADEDGSLLSFIDDVHFSASVNGESWGRLSTGSSVLAPQSRRTLGCSNGPSRIGPLVFSELQYNPGPPLASAVALDPTIDAGDLEYLEIYNPGTDPVSLAGWSLGGGIDFEFATSDIVAANETLLVVSFDPAAPANANRLAAFRNHYGIDTSVAIVGGYAGQLDNAGERVVLHRPGTPTADGSIPRLVEDAVVYDNLSPWPADANGQGSSLTRRAPMWNGYSASSWQAAGSTPGTATFAGGAVGDVTGDGIVDSRDIDVTWDVVRAQRTDRSFDFNIDGHVDTNDIVTLLASVLHTHFGDANLDGNVDATDFNTWQGNRFSDCGTWSTGDFTGDGLVDGSDFNVWNAYKFTSALAQTGPATRGLPRSALKAAEAPAVVIANDAVQGNYSTVLTEDFAHRVAPPSNGINVVAAVYLPSRSRLSVRQRRAERHIQFDVHSLDNATIDTSVVDELFARLGMGRESLK